MAGYKVKEHDECDEETLQRRPEESPPDANVQLPSNENASAESTHARDSTRKLPVQMTKPPLTAASPSKRLSPVTRQVRI